MGKKKFPVAGLSMYVRMAVGPGVGGRLLNLNFTPDAMTLKRINVRNTA